MRSQLLRRPRAAPAWQKLGFQEAEKYAIEAQDLDLLNRSIEMQLDKRRLIEQPFPGWPEKPPSSDGNTFENVNQLVTFLRNQNSREDTSP